MKMIAGGTIIAKYSIETIFVSTGNNKRNKPNNVLCNLSHRLQLRSSNKRAAFQN